MISFRLHHLLHLQDCEHISLPQSVIDSLTSRVGEVKLFILHIHSRYNV